MRKRVAVEKEEEAGEWEGGGEDMWAYVVAGFGGRLIG